jgi:hypothetical protein
MRAVIVALVALVLSGCGCARPGDPTCMWMLDAYPNVQGADLSYRPYHFDAAPLPHIPDTPLPRVGPPPTVVPCAHPQIMTAPGGSWAAMCQ